MGRNRSKKRPLPVRREQAVPSAAGRIDPGTPEEGPPHGSPAGGRPLLIAGLIFAVVVGVFLPTLRNGFVNLDDFWYVTDNVHVRGGFTWDNLRWALTTLDGGLWHPLTWLSHQLDCQLFGLNPAGHHLTGVLLHAMNSVLLFLALQRLTGATGRSATVAALFALHPLHVETIAWIADRKDALAACFWLLAMLAYAGYAEASQKRGPRRIWLYLLTLGLFVCGMMSKSTVITLPLVLLLLDWWPLGRAPRVKCRVSGTTEHASRITHHSWRALVGEKLPFLAAGFVIGWLGVRGQGEIGAMPNLEEYPADDRVQNAILSYGHYLAQTFWPVNLAGYYPYPKSFSIWLVAGTAALGLAISVAILWARRTRPFLSVGWIWYGLTLSPAIGLIQIGGHARADRYTYVPLIGVFLLVVWGLWDLTPRWRQRFGFWLCVTPAALLACAVITWHQIGYWRDSETFLNHILAVTGDNGLAHSNLGAELARQGRLDEALFHLQESLRILPHNADAENNLGVILGKHGRLDEAVAHLTEAVTRKPRYPEARCNLADALLLQGRLDDARREYETALNLRPDFTDAHQKLGGLLRMTGRFDEAMTHYRAAIRLEPELAEAHYGLGMALNEPAASEAIGPLEAAVKLNPNSAEAQCHLGVALGRLGKLDRAIIHFQEATRLKPDYAEARSNLETALRLKSAAPSPPAP